MTRIAVVSVGPAGSYLAWYLSDTEHLVLLFDPRVPDYERWCGGLSPLVDRRFPDVMALPFPRYRPPRVQLRRSDGSQVEQPPATTDWAIVSRADLGCAWSDRAVSNNHVRHVSAWVATPLQFVCQGNHPPIPSFHILFPYRNARHAVCSREYTVI